MAIFLHHYPASLFSEKVRVLLGYFGATWQSVEIPSIMPRPLLMPLTGGYRKTPVLSIDANVYCDTKIIARALARHFDDQQLYAHGFNAHRVADWADSQLFQVTVALNFSPDAIAAMMGNLAPEEAAAFQQDRAELAKGASIVSFGPEAAAAYLRHHLEELEAAVGDALAQQRVEARPALVLEQARAVEHSDRNGRVRLLPQRLVAVQSAVGGRARGAHVAQVAPHPRERQRSGAVVPVARVRAVGLQVVARARNVGLVVVLQAAGHREHGAAARQRRARRCLR